MNTKEKGTKKTLFSTFHIPHSAFYSRGFTFIETIVAIAVLVVSVVAPLSLASQGLRVARLARDQVIANFLAQEAVEFLRYKRDTNAIAGTTDWLEGLRDTCAGSLTCTVDVVNDAIAVCDTTCPVLQFNDTNGTYGYSADKVDWADTKFTRTVQIAENVSETEILATVRVEWSDVLVSRTYVLKERLFNWQ